MREIHQLRNFVTQTTHVIEGVTVASLSASLQRKTSVARDRQYQIALSRKLSRKFSSRVKTKPSEEIA
jgi:K+-sensing histidine kinase KdpD